MCASAPDGAGFSSSFWVATSKDAIAKTLQPLQGYERHAEWARKARRVLAILWRHLSKVTRNYDYVRAQRVSGVALGAFQGAAGSQSDSMLRALRCFSFSTLCMPYTRA